MPTGEERRSSVAGALSLTLNALCRVESVATTVATGLILVVMAVVVVDVTLRYVFNSPLAWAYDLISLYLLAGSFFLVLPGAYADRAHVAVDIAHQHFPDAIRRFADLITTSVSSVVFWLIAAFGSERALIAFQQGDVITGSIPWPTWPALAVVPFGSGLLAFRLLLHAAGHLYAATTGRDILTVHESHVARE
jgi:TRAP-type C4-dicarboxylate transport system permease small subunit